LQESYKDVGIVPFFAYPGLMGATMGGLAPTRIT
jgi:hypothetical protein